MSAVQDSATVEPVAASATTFSSSISTSAVDSSAAVITRPLRINVLMARPPPSRTVAARRCPAATSSIDAVSRASPSAASSGVSVSGGAMRSALP